MCGQKVNLLVCSLKVSTAGSRHSLRRAIDPPAMDFHVHEEKRAIANQGLHYHRKQRQQAAKERLEVQVQQLQYHLNVALCAVSDLQYQLQQVKSFGLAEQRAARKVVNKKLVLKSDACVQTVHPELTLRVEVATAQTQTCDVQPTSMEGGATTEYFDISSNPDESGALDEQAGSDSSCAERQARDMGGGAAR